MSRLIIFLFVVGTLAACGQPGSTLLPTAPLPTAVSPSAASPTLTPPIATTPPVETGTPIRVDLTPGQRAAMQALVEEIHVPVEQIKLISTEAVQWPDGCLGIVRVNARCMGGPVDGFRIILEANDQQYEFHTNQDGTAIAQLTESAFLRLALRTPDKSIQIVDTQIPVDPGSMPITTGLLPQAGVISSTIYALDFTNRPSIVATDQAGTRPLDFVHNPSYGLAVLSGDQPRLAWASSPINAGETSQLFSSDVTGSQLTTLLTNTTTITAPQVWVAQRWSQDGRSLYFSTEPYGIGGYILFAGASSLSRLNVDDQSVQEVIPFSINGGQMLCLDELSSDERLVADHCAQTSIAIRDLSSNQTTTIQPPTAVTGFSVVGSARFSPDLSRVAFALAKHDPDNEQGWVAFSDGLSGGSKLIATSQPGEYFNVIGWVNADTLLLQSNGLTCNPACTNSVWTVNVNGTGLSKVADGTFLTLVPPSPTR